MRNLINSSMIIYFLFVSFVAKAQCSSCTSSVMAGISAITVNSGEVICVSSGTTQSGNIIVQGGGKICFASGVTLTGGITVNNMNSSTAIIVQSGATISNAVSLNFNGTTTGGTIDNRGSWLKSGITLPNTVTFNNSGTFGVNGTPIDFNMNTGSTFINTGQVFINNFNFNNGATFSSSAGNVNIGSSGGSTSLNGAMNITGGGIAFLGSLTTNGSASLTTQPNTTFSVAGAVSNNGVLTIGSTPANIGGSVTNNSSGTITVNNTILAVGGAFSNNGAILAAGSCGRINIAGGSVQNGSGSVGALADICDASAVAPNLFDGQAGTVSPMATKCLCMPTLLPVTWVYISAKLEYDNSIHLTWTTIEEHNNDKFIIERSINSQDWISIAEIRGTNTLQPNYYNFIDSKPLPNANYYRIKQIDFDGKFSTSKIVVAITPNDNLQVYPNPFSENIVWSLENSNEEIILIRLSSVEGRIVGEQVIEKGAVSKSYSITTKNLPNGIYILEVITREKVWIKKLTKL